jgi:succinate dehydrogenase / fumarate reductase flavoprotein subunit
MQAAMQRHAAVFRSSTSLTKGVKKMDQVASRMSDIGISDHSLVWNTDLVEALELDNLMSQALITIRSAEQRHESRGAHAHEDFPDRDDKVWMKHTVMWLNATNKSKLGYRPVHLNTLTNEVKTIPPVARVY